MGFQYGHFEILTDEHGTPVKLGEGGMGITYKAWDKHLKLHAVVKVIHAKLLNDPTIRKRFFNEARSAARIRHPNVASVIYCCAEDETSDDDCFFAMEFINGESLYSRVQRHGPMPPGEALLLLRGIADALVPLGEAGFIHRDIKPQNIMIERRNRGPWAKLIDFGLVKALGDDDPDLYQSISQGGFLGSIYFASPEQVKHKKGDQLDCRTDFYSLGATLWHTLSGFPPFMGSQLEVMNGHAYEDPPWEKIAQLPEPALGLLRRLLAKRREDRPLDAECLVEEWDAAVEQLSPRPGPRVAIPVAIPEPPKPTPVPPPADDSVKVVERIPKPIIQRVPDGADEEVDADTAPDDPPPPSPSPENVIEPPGEAMEELFPLEPIEISGCMLPPAPTQLAQNAGGDWIAVRTVSGVNDRLRAEMLAMARHCMEAPHAGLLNVLAVGDDSIRSQWPCGVAVARILTVQGGRLPMECLLAWLPPLAEAVDWACAHRFHKTGMHPSQWLVTFPADVACNPLRFAVRKCEEWGEHSVLLDPLAGFAKDAAGAGATAATDPGIGAESLATHAQWLAAFARAIYEIAGGTMNGKFAPLAVLGEDRNLLLMHALGGRSSSESVSAWAAAFVAASKGRPPEPKPSEVRPAPHVTASPALPLPPPAPPLPPIIDPPPPKAGGNAGRRFVAALTILAVVVGAILWGKSMIAGNGNEPSAKVSPTPTKVPYVPPTAPPVVTAVPTVRPTPTATIVVSTPVPTPRPAARSVLDEGQIGSVFDLTLSGGQVIKLCYCPPGTFTMGSPKTEAEHGKDEGPVEVRISKGFWMAQTEMTQAQWEAVMGSNPSTFKGAKRPVDTVRWAEAVACIKKMEAMVKMPAGWKLALPTEAQWEYACRAGTKTVYSFGNQLNRNEANYDGSFPYVTTVKRHYRKATVDVGKYAANPWGLYDMHGNVWEWCADWYDTTLSGGLDPKGPAAGTIRVLRGGSWDSSALYCRAGSRDLYGPGLDDGNRGFRLVAVPAEP